MKRAMQVFAKYAPKYFGHGGKVKSIAHTEDLIMTLNDMRMDFVFLMEDDTYIHFEFQTTNKGIKDLVRFNIYDLLLFQKTGKPIKTYVVYSSDIKNPKSEYTYGGGNTYKVTPICMADKNAISVLEHIENKLKKGEPLTDIEQMDLVFAPIMGGGLTKEDVLSKALTMTMEYDVQKEEEIQAMLYTFALKFLDEGQMDKIKELVKMSPLGKMLIAEGREAGLAEGLAEGLLEKAVEVAKTLFKKGMDFEFVQEITGLSSEQLKEIQAQ
ncbi:MAG: hypothetical protein ATN36_04950 [Epulopiscium sp. Nele67-Bin005]|nr:MAG: hypothetical protein ATN36_04950 [Epulopiscium sp. Nele67-Bin005]